MPHHLASGLLAKAKLSPSARCVGLLATLCAFVIGCTPEPEPGEWGRFRYVGNVRGTPPLNLLPPISDRNGNAYVLYGELNLLELNLFIGHATGGWKGECKVYSGAVLTYGAHGWVGRSRSRAWYWAGEVLAGAVGSTGSCYRILASDPSSGAKLQFHAVVPWVLETPSRTTSLAWIKSPSDPLPYQVVLDLEQNIYTNARQFEPGDADGGSVEVLGVGGNLERREGVVVARYTRGGLMYTEAFFINEDGKTVDREAIAGLEDLPPYGILGFMQGTSTGLYAGVGFDGRVILLDQSGGGVQGVAGMTPVGVHVWEDELFVVGHDGGRPKIAAISDSGSVKSTKTWGASEDAAKNLTKRIDVVDDRSLPSRETRWDARNAMGEFPFLSPHTLDHYADGTTTWLVAGPDYPVGGETWTAIAYAPVGISYP